MSTQTEPRLMEYDERCQLCRDGGKYRTRAVHEVLYALYEKGDEMQFMELQFYITLHYDGLADAQLHERIRQRVLAEGDDA